MSTELNILNSKFEKSGSLKTELDLSPENIHESVVHQVVKATLAGRRQGTAATKNKALVSGGGKSHSNRKAQGMHVKGQKDRL